MAVASPVFAQPVSLPDTGAPIWPLALGRVLLVAAGAVLTAVCLRRG
jgi:hypothetical protein